MQSLDTTDEDRPDAAPEPAMIQKCDQQDNVRVHVKEIQRHVEHSVAHTGNVKSTFVFVFEGIKATIAPIFTNGNFVPDALRRNVHRRATNHRSTYCRGGDDIVPGLQGMGSSSTDVHNVR